MTSFSVGAIRCTYLPVGSFEIDAASVFVTPPGELAPALASHGLDPERLVFQARALLVDTGANRVVIDPAGTWEEKSRLQDVLAEERIDPDSIDTVVISHGHGDHFWGGVAAEGGPLFPKARYWMQEREWRHWLSSDNPEPDHVTNFEILLLIEDRFTLADGECEIVPGIHYRPAPGHSPGHAVVSIGKATGSQAMYTGDVLLSPLSVEHPDWPATFDVWADQVVATRRALLEELGSGDSLVLTSHLPGSGAGRVVAADGGGWRWRPE